MLSKYFQIPLTTINCKLPQYAAKAIDILSRKIDIVDKKAEQHIIDGELILRKSTI
jgi:DNA-binding LacI/PurR family transcriptional regulator